MGLHRSSGLGGKIIAALFLAAIAGYFWACVEGGRNPLDILNVFSRPAVEPDSAADARKKAPGAPKPPPPNPDPLPAPKADPRPEPPKPPPPEPPKPLAKTYSPVEMTGLWTTLDDQLRRGKLFEAKEKIQNTSKVMIPGEYAGKFADYEARVTKYYALVQETTRGILIDMPKISSVILKNDNKLVLKILTQTPTALFFETITGIRGKLDATTIKSSEDLKPAYASAEIKLELVKKAGYLGLEVADTPGHPLQYKDRPNRPRATGSQIFFDLADFCARNGANDKLVPLFDEALQRDPDLLVSVHEIKADRLVNVLLYFLGINAGTDAQKTLELLKDKYHDTKAYKERVAEDADVKAVSEIVMGRRSPVVPKTEPLAKVDTSPPARPDPLPAKPEPVPVKPEPRETERSAPDSREPTGLAMPDGTLSKIRDFVSVGDRHFTQAMQHLQASDPNINPDGWSDENKKALGFFQRAVNEGYIPAQDSYGKDVPPQALLDRVRETTMRMSLCRKRSVSTRK